MEWVKEFRRARRVVRTPSDLDRNPESTKNREMKEFIMESEVFETADERRQRWRSIYVIYFTMFQMSLGFSIVLTGVWPYLDKVSARCIRRRALLRPRDIRNI